MHDSTQISIKLASMSSIRIKYKNKIYSQNSHITESLNKLDTWQLCTTGDLTGSRIQGNKDFSLFSGTKVTPVGEIHTMGADHLAEQLPPVQTWGKHFATVPIPERLSGDVFRFVASESKTSIKYEYCHVSRTFSLSPGTFHELSVPSNCNMHVVSSKPILLVQFIKSHRSKGNQETDPSMILIPPIEQYAADYAFSPPRVSSGHFRSMVLLILHSADKSGLLVDGRHFTNFTNFHNVRGTDLIGGYIDLGKGTDTHTIKMKSPIAQFGATVYVIATMETYAYPMGLRMAPINLVSIAFCSPLDCGSETLYGLDRCKCQLHAWFVDMSQASCNGYEKYCIGSSMNC